jgi:hypothetical protein
MSFTDAKIIAGLNRAIKRRDDYIIMLRRRLSVATVCFWLLFYCLMFCLFV